MSLTLMTPPTGEPVALAALKAHLRLTDTREDSLVAGLGVAARQLVEAQAGLALMQQSWRYDVDATKLSGEAEIDLPLAPFIRIETVRQISAHGVTTDLPLASYDVIAGDVGRVKIIHPSIDARRFVIEFTVGWAAADDVPENLRLAIRQLTALWFENRETEGLSNIGVAALIAPWRRVRV